jgi:HPt (histidine-containing phosphotransfer) domain-containing protein
MNTSLFDMNAINAIKDMGDDFFAELVGTFAEDSRGYLEQLRNSLPAGDVETFRRAAHTLKSNANNFGATHMSELARELEMLARENRLEAVGDKVLALQAEFEKVELALKEM